MKGFSLKKWIERFRNTYERESYELSENDYWDYNHIAYAYDNLENLSKEQIKNLKNQYIKHQNEQALNNDATGIVMDDYYLKRWNLGDMEADVPTEDAIRTLLATFACGCNYNMESEYKKISTRCNEIINTYVNEGYNFYPLLEDLVKAKKRREKEIQLEKEKSFTTKDGKPANIKNGIKLVGGPNYDAINAREENVRANNLGIGLLENAERLSPYKEVFDISDKIGELSKMVDEVINNGDANFDIEGAKKEIEILREQLKNTVSQFDPDFLKATGDSRLSYLTASGSEMRNIHARGLTEVKRVISQNEHLRQNQTFTGVMGETPNIKDGIDVIPRS